MEQESQHSAQDGPRDGKGQQNNPYHVAPLWNTRPGFLYARTREFKGIKIRLGWKAPKWKQTPSGGSREMPLLTHRLLYCLRVFSWDCVQILLTKWQIKLIFKYRIHASRVSEHFHIQIGGAGSLCPWGLPPPWHWACPTGRVPSLPPSCPWGTKGTGHTL